MPRNSLYSLITTTDPRSKGFELVELMEMLESQLQTAAIHPHISNAIAAVLGDDSSRQWCLWEVLRDKTALAPPSMASYKADDQTRYFFRYEMSASANKSGSHPCIILEYSRMDRFEIRASCLLNTGFQNISVTCAYAREALTAMLLAIITSEKSNGTYLALATNFRRDFAAKFSKGPQSAIQMIEAIHSELLDVVDPVKKNTSVGFFEALPTFLNVSDGEFRGVLYNEDIGYISNDEGLIYLGSDCAVNTLVQDAASAALPLEERRELFAIMPSAIDVSPTKTVFDIAQQGIYPINPNRVLTPDEQSRVPVIPSWYIMTPQIMRITDAVYRSAMFQTPIRNVLLRGGAGTGKTEGAKAMANMFGLPYGHLTGHAEMEFFDLTSMLVPKTDESLTTVEQRIEYFAYALKNSVIAIPTFAELENFPDMAYQQITGVEKEDAAINDCLAALLTKLSTEVKSDTAMFSGSDSKFKTVRSELVRGLENGWLVELQEMNTIQKPGVLVGLNSILENGRLTLPTGEIIGRHPDSVIVFTQNVNYAGVGDTNQSVLSRLGIKCDLRQPSEDEMVERILSHVPRLDAKIIRTIVQVCAEIRDKCAAEIESGSVGTREAIAWAEMACLLGNVKEAADYTILPSCTEDPDDRARIQTSVLDLLLPS